MLTRILCIIIWYNYIDDVTHVRDAVMDMMADESYHLPSETNQICLSMAKVISAELQSPSEHSVAFCSWLVNQLVQIVDQSFSSTTSQLNREKLWMCFYQLQASKMFQNKWSDYLKLLQLSNKATFFQNCTSILYDNIIKMKFPVHDNIEPPAGEFNFEEENAVRYVGGYVIATLKKKYQSDKEIVAGLNQLMDKSTGINKATSATWVQEVNRGGFMLITDQAQDAFMSIEVSTKSKMRINKAHKMDEQTRHQLQNEVFCDSDVQFNWCLTGINVNIDDETAEETLELCIDQWITVKENAFANSIVEFYKQQSKKGTEKTKALRKTLN